MTNPIIECGDNADGKKEEKNELVFSYLTLRNLIGFSGIFLPLILAIAPKGTAKYYGFEASISDYFYTDRGDILVVVLCIQGAFLITYTGYCWKEQLLTLIAGICSIGVAFVPTETEQLQYELSVHTTNGGVLGFMIGTAWHIAFAAIFLICLAMMSLVFFTKSSEKGDHKLRDGKLSKKGKRNIVYKVCGWTIIASLVILGLYFTFDPDLGKFPVVFALESLAVIAFGISWITKGETLWPDDTHYIIKGIEKVKTMLK
ncbi:hypothetical protein [Pedobacter gandavensis]|uniref:hypothetical protein n=1 Tax=Pedobacter gandavensis TaxID=2679963 RepID=UPI00292CCAE0|nr:hypothetical protein [Pedobacter gandavensis]